VNALPGLDDLETPAAIVDLERMHRNIARMAAYAARHGLALRPHTKTHKAPWIGGAQLRQGARGLTFATLTELEAMHALPGEPLLAYPPVGDARLRRLLAVAQQRSVTVALDGSDAALALARAARRLDSPVAVLVELDLGMRRCGVREPEAGVRLAALIAEQSHLQFAGVLFYPGHIREHIREQDGALRTLATDLHAHLDALRLAGLPADIVSGGSTPTAYASHTIAGVNEIRPGTYVFNDRTTAALGACAWEDCAYTILATVVSDAVPGQVVVDAGSKALSREELRGSAGGFGALLEQPDVAILALSEEHGVLDLRDAAWRPRVGERVRIVPNHVCVSVNLQAEIWGESAGKVVERWEVAARNWAPAGAA
jgi:D-serine deaminase-like pyridoxal phosphate-dependent protein